ncbi:MAG: isoprenylcysteine carboxylmethyltransferase family protein [Anaerolineae bacterium]
MDAKLITRYAIRETLGLLVMGAALFWPAGRLDWWAGWAVLAVMAAWIAAMAITLIRLNPGLLAERLGPRKGAKPWDTVIMSLLGLIQLARYIIAGLDQRYDWTGGLPAVAQLAALALCVLGYALVVWATASNAFFSQIVRIQSERGHTVVRGGPYRYVRHPAYIGAILLGATALISLAEYRNKKPFWVRFSGFAGISTTETVSKSGEMVQSPMSPWQKSVFLCDSPILSG